MLDEIGYAKNNLLPAAQCQANQDAFGNAAIDDEVSPRTTQHSKQETAAESYMDGTMCWMKSVMRRIICSQQHSVRPRASLQHTV